MQAQTGQIESNLHREFLNILKQKENNRRNEYGTMLARDYGAIALHHKNTLEEI